MAVAPSWQLRRVRARAAIELLQRTYDAASTGRRTQGWRRSSTDANSVIGASAARLRDVARDLVRNNPYAESALNTIVDHTVGWGIVPTVKHKAFEQWSQSTDCDADGRHDLAGLQKLAVRTVVESGECIIRRRWRRLEDGFALPMQLQLLEPDYLDTSKDGALPNGAGQIIQGVEFDAVGYTVAYWLFPQHPGSSTRPGGTIMGGSRRVPAESVQLMSKIGRPGQVRAVSWFAPVLLRFKDFDEFEDATLMKQKIAACLALITTDTDGSAPLLGTADTNDSTLDTLSPGMIANAPPGRSIEVVQPPQAADYPSFTKVTLHAIAAGLGVSYEDLTGDYENLPFSAARMSRIRHWARVEDWRWRMLIPQMLDPVWRWAMEASELAGVPTAARTSWTPPGMPMIEPDKEGLAAMRNIRSAISTPFEEIRARGYEPVSYLTDLAEQFKLIDSLGLVLDCDARKLSQQGQMHPPAAYPPVPKDDKADNEAA